MTALREEGALAVMRRTEVDTWVSEVVDRVRSGWQDEDTRVELKGEWLDPRKAAKRLAGFANAARGETVLWLVGLTEQGDFTDPPKEELAKWLPGVEKCFDELAPRFVRCDAIAVDDHVVVAIVFETDGAPYVLKGEPGQEDQRQVLWRRGNRTEMARRQDLVRLLMPFVSAPEVEHRSCNLKVSWQSPQTVTFRVYWTVFIVPPPRVDLWLVPFRSLFRASFDGDEVLRGHPTFGPSLGGAPEASQLATPRLVEVRVEDTIESDRLPADAQELTVALSIGLAHSDAINLSARLKLDEKRASATTWFAGPDGAT